MNEDYDVLVKTLFMEGGSTLNKVTSIEDVIAIAWNIRIRAEQQKRRYGMSIKDVCLKRKQYSCWNDKKLEDVNIGNTFQWQICKNIAKYVMDAKDKYNPIKDATHYYNPDLCSPSWGSKLKKIHFTPYLNHIFGKGV